MGNSTSNEVDANVVGDLTEPLEPHQCSSSLVKDKVFHYANLNDKQDYDNDEVMNWNNEEDMPIS